MLRGALGSCHETPEAQIQVTVVLVLVCLGWLVGCWLLKPCGFPQQRGLTAASTFSLSALFFS